MIIRPYIISSYQNSSVTATFVLPYLVSRYDAYRERFIQREVRKMKQETIAIIGVGIAILAVVVPLLLFTLSSVNKLSDAQHRTNEVLVALANHRHDPDGAATFTLPAD